MDGLGVLVAVVHKLLQKRGDHAMEALGAVIGAEVEMVADSGHFFLVYQQGGGLGADDDIDLGAVCVQPLGLRIDRGGTDTAGDEDEMARRKLLRAHLDEFGGVSERADHVGEGLPFLEGHDVLRRSADGLRDDGNGTFLDIEIADGQRNALSFLICPDNQELAGLGGGRQPRCLHDHPADVRGQHFLLDNLVHLFLAVGLNSAKDMKKILIFEKYN